MQLCRRGKFNICRVDQLAEDVRKNCSASPKDVLLAEFLLALERSVFVLLESTTD